MNPEEKFASPQPNLKNDVQSLVQQASVLPPPAPETADPSAPPVHTFKYQQALRTYEGDIAAALSERKVSVAKIAIAENMQQQNAPAGTAPVIAIGSAAKPPSHGLKNMMLIILSIILLGGGAYGAYYFYLQSPLAAVAPQVTPQSPQGIVKNDGHSEILAASFTDDTVKDRITALKKTSAVGAGKIQEIYITTNQTGTKTLMPAAQILPLIAGNVPGEVLRSIDPLMMVGLLGGSTGNQPFVLANSTFFQSTFSGMLAWENTMYTDWRPFLIDPATQAETASTTTGITRIPHFEDATYRNKDLRVLKDTAGNIFFLYSFIDKQHLIITTNLATFDALMARFDTTNYLR